MTFIATVSIGTSEVQNCTVKVGAITLSEDRTTLNFNTHYSIGDVGITDDYFTYTSYDLDGDNPEIQAYAYLKTLSKFTDIVDS